MTEYIGCFDTDGVVSCEDRVSARFPFFQTEMRFCKKCMEGFPRGALAS